MRKKIKCKICGKWFLPLAENRYEVEDKSFADLLVGKAEIMEMFDCPRCGCQVLANLRKGHKPNEDS